MVTETTIYPDNGPEVIDLEKTIPRAEFYPALEHSLAPLKALPFVRELAYFKSQMFRNEIVDVP